MVNRLAQAVAEIIKGFLVFLLEDGLTAAVVGTVIAVTIAGFIWLVRRSSNTDEKDSGP